MEVVLGAKKDQDKLIRLLCGDQQNGSGNVNIIYGRGYLEKYFTYLNINPTVPGSVNPATTLLIGTIPLDAMVDKISMDIYQTFDENRDLDFKITVGDGVDNSRLMSIGQNDPAAAPHRYQCYPDYRYNANSQLYLYFSNQLPVTGSGRVIVYFN